MKKAIYFITMFSLLSLSFMPALAQTNGNISTGLTQDTTSGIRPVIKAKWEMLAATSTPFVTQGLDDSTAAGAQFMPSGIKDVNKKITICAIATDANGLADVKKVYADVFYPEGIALGNSHEALSSQSGLGCGELMQEDELATKLSKTVGIELFCTRIKNGNNNLPTFNAGYNYDEICKLDGELQKETAAVWCADKDISYEDPSGEYEVWAVGQDLIGLGATLVNHFDYLPLTAFETDFANILYDNVALNTLKIVNGDIEWTPTGPLASIRNIGNTRAEIFIAQSDMGFGLTNGVYNVKYNARIGNGETDWVGGIVSAGYYPFTTNALLKTLDLSEHNEMDFSILVTKFPPTNPGPYTGTMTLTAVSAPHLICDGQE